MLLVVQHPIADLRPFLGADSGALGRPAWPVPDPQHDYIRGTGRVRRRMRGGIDDWAGEDLYGDASRAIRFGDRLGEQTFDIHGEQARVRTSFRRFLSSGTVGRFEIGLGLDTGSHDHLAVATRLAQLPVQLRSGQQIKLIDAGTRLAAQLLDATTRHAAPGSPQGNAATGQAKPSGAQRWWMAAGNPVIVLEFQPGEGASVMPDAAQPVEVGLAGVKLWHAWIGLGGALHGTWLIERGNDERTVRRLRINLSRLHAERECLRIVLQTMGNGQRLAITQANSDGVQTYLNEAVHGLQKRQRFGIAQSPILEASMDAYGIAIAGQSASLDTMRRQVKDKVDAYIRRQEAKIVQNIHNGDVIQNTTTVGNLGQGAVVNVVTAKEIENAFNNAFKMVREADGATQDRKDKLDALIKQVQELVPQLPEETKAQALSDMETLTREATSAKPRRKMLEVSGEGLIEAAKTVAKMVPSITAAVAGLLTLFA
ncbi:hypothetical protein LF41_3038 [Lysobacter dokdonensis DS-58]|uniref:Uncharacterized protein n=1 Tax=Lysobacter dokdonensis DS-58 TaxID=1300345 RepID=A0A0A2WHU6_9GAMM|nr:hypothetical protein [Lysobacter dokdonensis]KGQ19388.1 hypothetical protein LF41_3038 [Lysobacter dokdonensis DS-58]